MIVADASAAVAAFAAWHDRQRAAQHALGRSAAIVSHAACETYSVLTRLPPPHRAAAPVVRDFLAARFPEPLLRLTGQAYRDFLLRLADLGVTGGAAYDALVAATAASNAAELVTCDRRAVPVYDRSGVRSRLL